MNTVETTETRELTTAELDEVVGGTRGAGPGGPVPIPYPNVTQSNG